MRSVQIRGFFWSVFSRIWTEYGYRTVFSPNAAKYVPEKAPYLDTFHAVEVVEKETLLVNNDKIVKTCNEHLVETIENLNTFG